MRSPYQDNFEEHLLVHLHELLVPFFDICGLPARVRLVIVGRWWVKLVVIAPFDDFLEHSSVDVGNGNGIGHAFLAEITDHVLDED